MITPVAGATVNADNPWPGLLAFRETDQGYFQGRQPETEELFRLVMRERLTVLFGLSGLGKSSLLQAGLFPRLRRENVFPVYLRFDFSDRRPDLVGQVCLAIAKEAAAHEIEAPPAKDGETLWEYFHREGNNFWNTRNRPVLPLLVFDQFEEIFTLGRLDPGRTAATEAFVDQLADLVEGRAPAALKARLDEHPEEAGTFNFGRDHYKILLGIREDFLPELEALRAHMPAVALNRMRLRRMHGEAALLVVNQAEHLVDPGVAERIVRFVAADKRSLSLADLEVEPALLSVVSRELNNKRLSRGEPRITAGLLEGSHEQVLTDFYDRSTADLAPEVRYLIEDNLLTVSGYRDSVALENALRAPGVSRAAIDQLVERRLVRREDRGGAPRLELTHDLLAGVVRASRDSRRQREEAERQRLAAHEARKQQRRTLRKLMLLQMGFILVAVLGQILIFEVFGLRADDLHFLVRGSQRPSDEIVLIVADNKTADKFPEPMLFWHPYYATIIRAAVDSGAKVIGFDNVFLISVAKWEPDNDAALAAAFAYASKRVGVVQAVLPASFLQDRNPAFAVPVNMLASAFGTGAFSFLTGDPDDVVRRLELIEPTKPNAPLGTRSLALRMAERYLGQDAILDSKGNLALGGHIIGPARRPMVINYAGGPETLRRISMADFVEAARAGRAKDLREWVSGKAVLIGSDDRSDTFATPFNSLTGAGTRNGTAGLEIQANALRTILERRYLVTVPRWASSGAFAIVFIAGLLTASKFDIGIAIACALGEIAIILTGTHLLFLNGWILPIAGLTLALTISISAGSAYRILRAARRTPIWDTR
jgi:CHASE2 domain-containing sensor protein